MDWKTLLAYITGTVTQELLLRNEYLVTENRILRHQVKGSGQLSDGERSRRSPHLNVYAERWVRSVKEEYLARLILCGEALLHHALTQCVEYCHHEQNHQSKGNVLLLPAVSQDSECQGPMQCRERLGGLLRYYARAAA